MTQMIILMFWDEKEQILNGSKDKNKMHYNSNFFVDYILEKENTQTTH